MQKISKLLKVGALASAMGVLSGLAGCASPQAVPTAPPQPFSPAQEQAISAIVAKTLINNPSILLQTVQALKAQQANTANQQALSAISKNASNLLNDEASPFIGPENASVVVIEFFDYQCVYCHQVYPEVKSLIAAYPNVKFIFKEFPIFGASSEYAAKMSIVAFELNKFESFHNALFDTGLMEGKLTPDAVDKVAAQVGINLSQAKTMMQGLSVSGELSRNQYLAQQLGIGGTPDFVVMPNSTTVNPGKVTFLPGAVPAQALTQAIIQAQ